MKKKKGATYLITIHGNKEAVRKAAKSGALVGVELVAPQSKEHLADASAVEFDPPAWDDTESLPPETRHVGF